MYICIKKYSINSIYTVKFILTYNIHTNDKMSTTNQEHFFFIKTCNSIRLIFYNKNK